MAYDHYVCVFFFKQKTAYEMRISDWSSDVCSSDLPARHRLVTEAAYARSPTMLAMSNPPAPVPERPILVVDDDAKIVRLVRTYLERDEIGRAPCRERVCQYV